MNGTSRSVTKGEVMSQTSKVVPANQLLNEKEGEHTQTKKTKRRRRAVFTASVRWIPPMHLVPVVMTHQEEYQVSKYLTASNGCC
jgi:hypothetical protein